jgi:hypothetical protein
LPNGGGRTRGGERGDEELLEGQSASFVELWSTPRSTDGEKGGPNMAFGAGGTPLPTQAAAMSDPPSARPTAGANDHKGSNRPGQRRRQLDEASEHWKTPRTVVGEYTRDAGRKGAERLTLEGEAASLEWMNDLPEWKREEMLEKGWHTCDGCEATTFHDMVTPCLNCGEIHSGTVTYPSSLPAPATATVGEPSSETSTGSPRPRLNPCFVAWLMGWPLTAVGICDCLATASFPSRPHTPSCGCGTCWFRRMRSELERLVS